MHLNEAQQTGTQRIFDVVNAIGDFIGPIGYLTFNRLASGVLYTILNPFKEFTVLTIEDPKGTRVPSVLIQNEVTAKYSGALLTDANGEPIIEGVPGRGDLLMVGTLAPVKLPTDLSRKLRDLHCRMHEDFGSIRREWVYDGDRVWILQLQQEAPKSAGSVIVDGNHEVTFRTDAGLEELRALTQRLYGTDASIRLVGNIGITSHMADILRRANVPSRLVRE
jgi:hypothetical protein